MIEINQYKIGSTLESVERMSIKIMKFRDKGERLERSLQISARLNLAEDETAFVHMLAGYRLLRNESSRLKPQIKEHLANLEFSINSRAHDSLLNKYLFKPLKKIKQIEIKEVEETDKLCKERIEAVKQDIGANIGHKRANMIQEALHDVLTLYFDINKRGVTSKGEKKEANDNMNRTLNFWRDSLENNRREKP